jgi:hypothetical protein
LSSAIAIALGDESMPADGRRHQRVLAGPASGVEDAAANPPASARPCNAGCGRPISHGGVPAYVSSKLRA